MRNTSRALKYYEYKYSTGALFWVLAFWCTVS